MVDPGMPSSPQPSLSGIFNAAQPAVIATSPTGSILFWNRSAEIMYGWAAEETLGRNLADVILPTGNQAALVLKRLSKDESWSDEIIVQHKDGSLFTVTLTHAPLMDAGSQFSGSISVSVVADAKLQIEKTVNALAAIVHPTNDAILGCGLDSTILALNTAAEQMFGCSAREAVGQPSSYLLPPQCHNEIARLCSLVRGGQQIENYELAFQTDGQQRNLQLSLSSIVDRANRVIGSLCIIRDMTEQKRTERQLRESETRHELILSSISDAVFITDDDGQFTYICSNVDVIWGYNPTEVAAFGNIARLLGSTLCDTTELDATGELRNIECEITTASEGKRLLLVNIKRVSIDHGTRLYTCRDATERKQVVEALHEQTRRLKTELTERQQVEAALRDNETLLRNVLESLPVGVWVTDATGNIIITNAAVKSIWGGIRYGGIDQYEEYVAWFADTGERVTNERWGLTRSVLNGVSTKNDVLDIQTFDGQLKTILDSSVPIFDEDGRINGAIEVCQDITELRRAQQAEREERQFATALSNTISKLSNSLDLQSVLETILENIGQVVPHDAANITLIEGDTARPVCWTGYKEDCQVYFSEVRYPLTTPWIRQMMETGAPDLVRDPTGKPNWPTIPGLAWIGSILSTPIRAHDTIIGFLNLDSATKGFYTMTHWNRLRVFADQAAIAVENARLYTQVRNHANELEERVRERTLELEEALAKEKELSELKSRFVSMVSHEFRTPLASIQTSSDLLQHYYERLSADRRREALRQIDNEIKRLTTILQNILAFGRAEAVGITVHPAPGDLVRLCREVAQEARQSIHDSHRLVIRTNQPEARVEMDAQILRHALINLLENAIKYSPPASTVQLTIEVQERQVKISIRDEGIGIPPNDVPRLFEAFHRGENVGTAHGTGLGLVIVKQAVDAHRGSIHVDTQLGSGTTFSITLPCSQPD